MVHLHLECSCALLASVSHKGCTRIRRSSERDSQMCGTVGMKMRRTTCEVLVVSVSLKRWVLVHTFHFGGLPWEVQPRTNVQGSSGTVVVPQLRTCCLQGRLQLFVPMLRQQQIHVVKAGWHARGRCLWVLLNFWGGLWVIIYLDPFYQLLVSA